MTTEIRKIAKKLVAAGKGILAADESNSTAAKRLERIAQGNTEANRREMRDMFFSNPDIEKYISGVILFDETIRQSNAAGVPFSKILQDKGIEIGIKVDKGLEDMPGCPNEMHTRGLSDLDARLKEYKALGASFAKWRALFKVNGGMPTTSCIVENAKRLAQYARICQANGIVPIVEPEVYMENDQTIKRVYDVTEDVLMTVFEELAAANVDLAGIILKPSMVIAGTKSSENSTTAQVAECTIRCLKATVPHNVAGIAFLSGGQTPQQAVDNLNAMNRDNQDLPWPLTYSYGRALQEEALKAWHGVPEQLAEGHRVFIERAQSCSKASKGEL